MFAYLPSFGPAGDAYFYTRRYSGGASKSELDLPLPWPIGDLLELYGSARNRDAQLCSRKHMHADLYRPLVTDIVRPQIASDVSKESGDIGWAACASEPFGSLGQICITRC